MGVDGASLGLHSATSHAYPNAPTLKSSGKAASELDVYLGALRVIQPSTKADQSVLEEIRTTSLFSWLVKQHAENSDSARYFVSKKVKFGFSQFSLLGEEIVSANRPPLTDQTRPIFLNTDAPLSAFLCGSQGSGKSYTLSCMLEGCLLPNPSIGKLPKPLAGILFHYDPHNSLQPCEAAFLASHINVTILVSPSNYWERERVYKRIQGRSIRVRPLLLQDKHLNVQRMRRLMAFNDTDGSIPLYMEVIVRILRAMAIEAKGTMRGLSYADFLRRLNQEDGDFSKMQKGPMNLRLQLLNAFMSNTYASKKAFGLSRDAMAEDLFATKPGTLTIVDLSDPFIDPASACSLFDMCLALFLEHETKVGRVIALDEAHKFMTATDASNDFTDSLLQLIRQQRHKGARIIISTQEPTVSPRLLDLCSMTFVHRFTSPAWLASLRGHLAGASELGSENGNSNGVNSKKDLMNEIVNLGVGESLLFAPGAMLDVVEVTSAHTYSNGGFQPPSAGQEDTKENIDPGFSSLALCGGDVSTSGRGNTAAEASATGTAGPGPCLEPAIKKLGMQHIKFRTRPRLTSDGGRSILASTGVGR